MTAARRVTVYARYKFALHLKRLKNELCYDYNYELCSLSKLSVISPTSQLILQPFRSFHTSQLILQPFRCFTYVTAHSPTVLSLHLYHRLFTYVTWRAIHEVPRKLFGAKRDEITGEWRIFHETERHAFYSSPIIIRNFKWRRLRWAGHVVLMELSRNAYRVLEGIPEGKRPLGRPRRRWEDNIKMDLREVGCDPREWIALAECRDQWRAYVRVVMNNWVS